MPKVADVMTRDVITVTPETTLRELATILSEKHINGVPVVDDKGNVLGVVSESDLVNQNKPLHIPTVFVILDSVIPMENPWRLQKEFSALPHHGRRHRQAGVGIAPDTDFPRWLES
jgi:hypothetical protein